MNNQKIISSNHLIAKFMGGFLRDMGYGDMVWDHAHFTSPLICKGINELEYHSDWKWLMPVVEKIEEGDIGFKLCRKRVEVYVDSTKEILFSIKLGSRLESLYAAVVEYLTKYQTQHND